MQWFRSLFLRKKTADMYKKRINGSACPRQDRVRHFIVRRFSGNVIFTVPFFIIIISYFKVWFCQYSHNKNISHILFSYRFIISHARNILYVAWNPETFGIQFGISSSSNGARVQPFISMYEHKFTSCLLFVYFKPNCWACAPIFFLSDFSFGAFICCFFLSLVTWDKRSKFYIHYS